MPALSNTNPGTFTKKIPNVNFNTFQCLDKYEIKKSPSKRRILIVEDNPINQKVAKLFLEGMGYEADIAENGCEALALVHQGYSLILMDIDLPDIDGFEITQKIRSEKHIHVPIIACTANGESYRAKCLAAGMDGFILKPIMLETLYKIMNDFLTAQEVK